MHDGERHDDDGQLLLGDTAVFEEADDFEADPAVSARGHDVGRFLDEVDGVADLETEVGGEPVLHRRFFSSPGRSVRPVTHDGSY